MKQETLKSAMFHGAIVGLIFVTNSLVAYLFGYNEFKPLAETSVFSVLSYLILIIGIVAAQRDYRDNTLSGTISYRQGLWYAILVGISISVFHSAYKIVLLKYFDAETLQQILDFMEYNFISAGLPQNEIKEVMQLTNKTLALSFMFAGMVNFAIITFCIALFSSFKIKRTAPNNDNDNKKIE